MNFSSFVKRKSLSCLVFWGPDMRHIVNIQSVISKNHVLAKVLFIYSRLSTDVLSVSIHFCASLCVYVCNKKGGHSNSCEIMSELAKLKWALVTRKMSWDLGDWGSVLLWNEVFPLINHFTLHHNEMAIIDTNTSSIMSVNAYSL